MTILRHRWIACALLLGGSGVWAASILTSPPAPREDAREMRALIRRLSGETTPVPAVPQVAVSGTTLAPILGAPATGTVVAQKTSPRVAPALATHPKPPALPGASSAAQIESTSDPIKNLALTGVTHVNGEDEALVTDLSNRERASGAVGGRVFGFEIKEIGEDRVRLFQGGVDYLLRLGEKAVPESVRIAGAQGGDDDGGFPGFGAGGGPGGGGQRAFGGPGAFGNRGFGDPSGFGGQGNHGGGGGPASLENGGGEGYGGRGPQNANQGGSGGGSNGGGQAGGGFGGGFAGGGFGSGGTGSASSSGSRTATANPQTARRTGSQLESGVQAQPSPEAISNPQTQRRLGTTNGPAFGDGSGTNSGQNGVSQNGSRGRTN